MADSDRSESERRSLKEAARNDSETNATDASKSIVAFAATW